MIKYSIPDLKFDVLIVDLNCPGTELNANGEIVLLSESLISEL
jgi:hypothetical protein